MATDIQVNIGSAHAMLPDGTNALVDPILINHQSAKLTGGNFKRTVQELNLEYEYTYYTIKVITKSTMSEVLDMLMYSLGAPTPEAPQDSILPGWLL